MNQYKNFFCFLIFPIIVSRKINFYWVISKKKYVKDNAVTSGKSVAGKVTGTTAHHDTVNKMTVITNSNSGKVITVDHGIIKQWVMNLIYVKFR